MVLNVKFEYTYPLNKWIKVNVNGNPNLTDLSVYKYLFKIRITLLEIFQNIMIIISMNYFLGINFKILSLELLIVLLLLILVAVESPEIFNRFDL